MAGPRRSSDHPRITARLLLCASLLAPVTLGACGSDDQAAEATADVGRATTIAGSPQHLRRVSPTDGAAILADAPEGLIVLDVRTPAEFAEGHLEGATLLDLTAPSFDDDLAALDPDAPYLVYCRSGNRSGQALERMADLGFTDVTDIDGGILAWTDAGLALAG